MSVKPLTATEVKGLKPREKDYAVYDGFGLLLHISRRGGKVWRFRYSHPVTKKRQTYTIGRLPEFTLPEARDLRDELRRMLARGIDPISDKKNRKENARKKNLLTFAVVANEWFGFKKKESLRKKSLENIDYELNKYLIPFFGNMCISSINAPIAIAAFEAVSGKNALQNKLISRLNEIMNYAVNCGVVDNNPVVKIKSAFNSKKSIPRAALPVDELPLFIEWWETEAMKNPPTHYALLFHILTMSRPIETIRAEWIEIDFQSRLWTIPADKMKCHREHVVPLSSQAIDILLKMKEIKKGKYIFFSLKNSGCSIGARNLSNHISIGPFSGRATLHGFRSMWSTLLNEEGFNPDVIESALAHKSGDAIRDIYNRSKYMEQRRIMMQWIGDFFDSARKGIIVRSSGYKGLKIINE
ncbi:tyrosine-type recombinase/integrase [Rahnella aceris]|uniref:tyrosine-type recombinase/integrase n=1 Tax=Rahnella sp. (strain Y9602) TaxID=2703885 RepID=UPI003FD3DAD4